MQRDKQEIIIGKNKGDKHEFVLADRVHPYETLSPQEFQVAMLIRSGNGRNAVAAILSLSPNTIKTIQRRIREKLGHNWQASPRIWWPDFEASEEIAITRELPGALPTDPYLLGPRADEYREMVQKHHRISALVLIHQSRPGQVLLHVSGEQRFWFKPVLDELLTGRYIKLLHVDWYDVFNPPWLPIVNNGRRGIRAASYRVRNERFVGLHLQKFLDSAYLDRMNEVKTALEGTHSSFMVEDF